MPECRLLDVIAVNNTLGECILWDERGQCVWWTDIHQSRLYRYILQRRDLQQFELPGRLCSFGFIAGDERLICAFAEGFALYLPRTGELQWLLQPERGCRGLRFNDGRVDRQGRFWAGTMVEDASEAKDAAGQPLRGSLYWMASGGHGKALGDIGIANSLCWNLAGDRMYFADTTQGKIMAYAFDPLAGTVGEGHDFASTAEGCAPDGSIIDAEDCLWNAQWGGGKLLRYSPDGQVLAELAVPVTQPTCQCFGGPELNLLFVSSARENLDAQQLHAQPGAGNVFIFATPYQGVPENRYLL